MLRIGLISDTHGLLRPQAEQFLAGCDHIVHAGDIGDPAILERLAALAPLTAIRGNNDRSAWAAALPHAQAVQLGGVTLFVLHDLKELATQAPPAGTRVIVCGHSHKPQVSRRSGILVVNPGSAGRRRFTLPVSAAELLIRRPDQLEPRLVDLL